MARSDDTNGRKRGPARPKATAGTRKAARPKAGASKPAAPRKKAAPAAKSRSSSSSAKAPAAKPAGAKVPAGRTLPPAKATGPKAAEKKAARPRAESRPKPARKAAAKAPRKAPPGLDEEQRIGDAKYQPRDLPPRLFEEERFIFPESYGQSRIRLLVKDPEWLFAHWDVDPQSLADLRAELGERASALSKLTLRVSDPQHGGESRVLLPDGARSWYVRADVTERSYRAELGLTLPSGEFRSLAESNTVRTPRSGPAAGAAPRRARYDGAAPETPEPAKPAPRPSAAASDPGPWRPDPSTSSYPGPGAADRPADARRTGRPGEPSGGASDVHRR